MTNDQLKRRYDALAKEIATLKKRLGSLPPSIPLSRNGLAGAISRKIVPQDLKAVLDAKGDLLIASGADAVDRFPIGDDDQILVADSSQPLGVRWADPTSGGGYDLRLEFVAFALTPDLALIDLEDASNAGQAFRYPFIALDPDPDIAFRSV